MSVNKTYTVNENSSISFTCVAAGLPQPSVTWYRNGTIINDTRFVQLPITVKLLYVLVYQVTSTLNLTMAVDEDSDTNYSCRANNTVGNSSDTFQLDVLGNAINDLCNIYVMLLNSCSSNNDTSN